MIDFGNMPGMGDIMKLAALFAQNGNTQQVITDLVQKYATNDNVKMVTGNLIKGIGQMQKDNNTRYVLYVESTVDNKDVIVKIMARDPVTFALGEHVTFYLSQITQEQIITVINLFFSNGATKQLTAGQ